MLEFVSFLSIVQFLFYFLFSVLGALGKERKGMVGWVVVVWIFVLYVGAT